MDIVVNDTNIFLDLISIDLLQEIFKLPCQFHTVDFVIEEITNPSQKSLVETEIANGHLYVKGFSGIEIVEVYTMYSQNNSNVSIPDCSVWYYAKQTGARLLTGDKTLRKQAEKDGIVVSGILFLLKELVRYGIVEPKIMAEKLKQLLSINARLPKQAIHSMIEEYNEECIL